MQFLPAHPKHSYKNHRGGTLGWLAPLALGMATVATLCPIRSTSAQEKTLRWKLQAGQALTVRYGQKITMETMLHDRAMSSEADLQMDTTWTVQRVAPGGIADIIHTINRLKMTMASPTGQPLVYDSAEPTAENPMSQQLARSVKPLLGIDFLEKMDARGNVLDLRLSADGETALRKTDADGQVKDLFSKEGMQQLVHQAIAVLPSDPIAPGARWRDQTETSSPMGMLKTDLEYHYIGSQQREQRTVERIDVKMTLAFPDQGDALGLKIQVKEQDNSGILYFDAAAGRFIDSTIHQKMVLEAVVGERTHRQKLATTLHTQFLTSQETARPANQAAKKSVPALRISR